jgi:hypothetical protein
MGVRGKLGDVPGEKLAAFARKPLRAAIEVGAGD